jgi:hypothetical protein
MLSCGKDKFTTAPQLKYKSVNTTKLKRGEIIEFKLSFTDKEGDLQDNLFIQKVVPRCEKDTTFKIQWPLPVFPTSKNTEGEITVTYAYGIVGNYPPIGEPKCGENDTCYFRFVLKDKAQNISDTVQSETIIIYK